MNILSTEKLEEVKKTLKEEFDGIDDIINRVIDILSGWGSKRQLDKPIVVPIFGLTGTGKTSLIKRLVELLDLGDKFYPITFGCSTESDKETRPAAKLLDKIGFCEYDNSTSITEVPKDCIMLLDDIHQCRTIDEDGREEESEITEFFEIMDSGKLSYIPSTSSDFGRVIKWHKLLEKTLLPDLGDVIVENAIVTDTRVMDKLDELHYLNDLRKDLLEKSDLVDINTPGVLEWQAKKNKEYYEDYDRSLSIPIDLKFELGINPVTGEDCLSIAPFGRREYLRDILIELTDFDSISDMLKSLRKRQTIKEFIDSLAKIIKFIKQSHYIDFSESLIFVTGNLDEAFDVAGELDPDVDADLYNKITSQVNITDIKTALLTRFNASQVARLGNNPIIYPSFSKETFRKLINRNIKKDFDKYSEISGIKLSYDSTLVDMIYSEGVFPTQGARTIRSTVDSLGIVFSRIEYLENSEKGKIVEIKVSAKPEKGEKFNCDKAIIELVLTIDKGEYSINKIDTIEYKLVLGSLRNPEKDKNRYGKAVHELGHALGMLIETGRSPSSIITTSSANSGGFCLRNIDVIDGKDDIIESPELVKSNVRISLAGWVAERVIFDDDRYQLLGSGIDISGVWKDISYAYYKGGLKVPISFGDATRPDGIPLGVKDDELMLTVKEEIETQEKKIRETLTEFKKIIAFMAMDLAEKGTYSMEEFDYVLKVKAKEALHESTLIDGKDIVDRFFDLVKKNEEKRATPKKYLEKLEEVLKEKPSEEKKPGFFKRIWNKLTKKNQTSNKSE